MTTDKAKYIKSLIESIDDIDTKIGKMQMLTNNISGDDGMVRFNFERNNGYEDDIILHVSSNQMKSIVYTLIDLYKEWKEEEEKKLEQE